MHSFQLLLKPVSGRCNLACTYCFYRSVPSLFAGKTAASMPDDVLRATVQKYLALGFRENVFIWQGGEPLLAGLDFYERVVGYQQQFGHGQVVGNVLQTNGVLVDDRWADFFAKYKFFIGLSIDGSEEIHDAFRGKGSHPAAMKAAKILSQHHVEFNVLAVLHKGNVGAARDMYAFLRTLPTPFLQFIPALDNDPVTNQPAPHSLTPKDYARALQNLFSAWLPDAGRISVRDFDSLLHGYLGLPGATCTFQQACAPYLVVESDGGVYPCDFFVRPQHALGHVQKDSFPEMVARREQFAKQKMPRDTKCKNCLWLPLCFGGCLKDRVFSSNPHSQRSYFCPAYKQFFQHTFHWFATKSLQLAREQGLRPSFLNALPKRGPCLCGSGRDINECAFRNQTHS